MSNITQNIKTLQITYPQLYSYILPTFVENEGSQKIGYTGQENVLVRIKQQVETAAKKLKYNLLWKFLVGAVIASAFFFFSLHRCHKLSLKVILTPFFRSQSS